MAELNLGRKTTPAGGRFEKIFIHRDSLESKVARRVRELFPAESISEVSQRPLQDRDGALSAREFSRSKRLLYIAPHAGRFFKRCPGSRPGLMCCNYFVLNLGLQCDMNCTYCYLQSYINTPALTVYSNLDQAMAELRELRAGMPGSKVRVGTGEVIDSLSLDDITLYSRDLIGLFREFPEWTLEFKTKSAQVNQFLDVPHGGNVVVSWSVNPQNLVEREEPGTAALAERLDAARRCRARGFQIAFHIDPMIWHPEWRESYAALVDAITGDFKPEDVPYLSVGALRFQPGQRHLMRERFGMRSWVTQAEVFPGHDGKLRYDSRLRAEMFDFIIGRFKAHSRAWRIFMCMETPETWISTMDQVPHRDTELRELFDGGVIRRFKKIAPATGNCGGSKALS
jgi:spore photoproduct lyase